MLGEVSFELGTPKTPRNDMLTKTGWWLSPTPLKNMKVSWDDSSQLWNNKFMFQATNQPTCYTKQLRFRRSFGRCDPGSIKNHQNNGSIAGRVIARVIGSPKMDGFGVPQMKNPPERRALSGSKWNPHLSADLNREALNALRLHGDPDLQVTLWK